jgi:O-antigen ligase
MIPMPARNAVPAPQDQTSDVLRNLLVYGFVFYLFAFTAPDLLFGPNKASGSASGNIFNQLILPALFFATCIVARSYRISVQRLWRALVPMAPFLLVMVLSTLWSDYPELTLRRASRELLEAIALVTLAACFSSARAMLGVLFRAFVIIGCLDLASAVIFSDSHTDLGFAGIHGHKNVAGEFFVVALPVYLLGTLHKEISGSRLLGLFSLMAGIAMLVATQSKTSAGAIVFGLAALLPARYLFRRNPSLRVSSQLLFLLGLLCAVAVILNWGPSDLLNSLIGDPTLTGRDQIWLYVTQKFNASPVFGVGYGAVWQVGPEIEAALKRAGLIFVFNEAHNGYLDIAAQLGAVGVLCLVIFLIATLRNSLSYWATTEENDFRGAGALTIYFFWALVLSNITESLYFQPGVGSSGMLIFLGGFVASRNVQLAAPSPVKVIPRALRRSIASEA